MNFNRYRKSERLLENTNMCISFHSYSQLISVNETPGFHFSVCPIVRILCVYACVYVCACSVSKGKYYAARTPLHPNHRIVLRIIAPK